MDFISQPVYEFERDNWSSYCRNLYSPQKNFILCILRNSFL